VKALGDRIRERRDEKDLSLRELAKRVACSPPFLSDIEHGRRFPSEQVLADIARVLGLGIDELRELDPRTPVEGLKRMTERDPTYALAFRTMIEKQPTADELLVFLKSTTPAKPTEK